MWTLRITRPRSSGVSAARCYPLKLQQAGTHYKPVLWAAQKPIIYLQQCEWTPADRDHFLLCRVCFHPSVTRDGAISATFAKTVLLQESPETRNFHSFWPNWPKEPTRTPHKRKQIAICRTTLAVVLRVLMLHVHFSMKYAFMPQVAAQRFGLIIMAETSKELYYSSYLGLRSRILAPSVSLHVRNQSSHSQ